MKKSTICTSKALRGQPENAEPPSLGGMRAILWPFLPQPGAATAESAQKGVLGQQTQACGECHAEEFKQRYAQQ